MKQFFMCYVEGANTPAIKHETYSEAFEESRRLAKAHKRCAYVLRATAYSEVYEPPVKTLLIPDEMI